MFPVGGSVGALFRTLTCEDVTSEGRSGPMVTPIPVDPRSWPARRRAAAVALLVLGPAIGGILVGQALAPEPPAQADSTEDPLESRGWTYIGVKLVAGPGRGALPLLPLDVNEEGRLVGRPTVTTRIEGGNVEDATLDVRPWFGYCGQADAPGLTGNWAEDDVLRYADVPHGEEGPQLWNENWTGEPVRPAEVPVGEPFYATWRTPQDAEGADRLLFGLIRWNATEAPSFPWNLPFAHEGIMAWSMASTHHCASTYTQPVRWKEMFNHTEATGRHFPWLQGVPHLIRDAVSYSAWDPSRVVVDERTGTAFPEAGGGTTLIPPHD